MKKNFWVKGMKPIDTFHSINFQKILNNFQNIMNNLGYNLIFFPVVNYNLWKNTNLNDSLFTFFDKKNRNLILRPEFTLQSIYLLLQNGVFFKKLWYFGSCYRYEQPQFLRKREFFQIGVEVITKKPVFYILELIIILKKFFKKLNISKYSFEVNDIDFLKILFNEFNKKDFQKICSFLDRKNLTDLKKFLGEKIFNEKIIMINQRKIPEYLSKIISLHKNIIFNPYLVRGINYYSSFVFEIKINSIQICGGGIYDYFFKNRKISGIGFGIGVERLSYFLKNKTPICEHITEVNYPYFKILKKLEDDKKIFVKYKYD